jgi:hypothetical protein
MAIGLVWVCLGSALSGCSKDPAPTPDGPPATPVSAVAPEPQKPLLVGPEIVARLATGAAPPADAGSAGAEAVISGPVLGAESVEIEDAWTLPETPTSWRVTLRHANRLSVRLDDAERLPWAVRTDAHPTDASGALAVDVTPLHALAAGARYVLVIEGELVDAGERRWSIPIAVEIGADGPAPWQERPAAPKAKRKKRR